MTALKSCRKSNNTTQYIARFNSAPIAIGGVGGSGTRLIAEIARELGVFMGKTLNKALDNLDFIETRRLLNLEDEEERLFQTLSQLEQFEVRMHKGFTNGEDGNVNWGWKVPGQFHLLPYSARYFTGLKYIHVMRHGLDMAFSANKNQLRNWGSYHGIESLSDDDPVAALRYWLSANHLAIEQGRRVLGSRFMLLNFDDLCQSPEVHVSGLAQFILGDDLVSPAKLDELCDKIKPPVSMNRYKSHEWSTIFDEALIEQVRQLGFNI